MRRICVVVSDLHINRDTPQNDFRSPSGVARGALFYHWCRQIVSASAGGALTLVLNGDVFDFWEIGTDAELKITPGSIDEIRRNLVFAPCAIASNPARATEFTTWQLENAIAGNHGVIEGLREVLSAPNSQLVYLFGNHDHAMANPALQAAFRAAIGNVALDPSRVQFGHWWEDRELGVYAEHGNQFADEDSRFRNVTDWQEEALGYFALRFIWNRYQYQFHTSKPTAREILGFLLRIVRERANTTDIVVVQYLIDYFMAADPGPDQIVPKLVPGYGLGTLRDLWAKKGKPPEAEEFLVRLFSKELNDRVRKTGSVHGFDAGMRANANWPGEVTEPHWDYDKYNDGLRGRFKTREAPFPRLDPSVHRTLFLGHTHRQLNQRLYPYDDSRDHRYVNTGSWTTDSPRPLYAVTENVSGTVETKLLMV